MGIKIGIVGCGYGRSVLVPAFRTDPRSEIIAIAATTKEHAQVAASELGIERAYANWRALVDDHCIDAIVVATPPYSQPEIVVGALRRGKAVFAEKPMALNVIDAREMTEVASAANRPNMVDFNFTEISVWQQARRILAEGRIGKLHHVAIHWHVENYANRMRLANWKSSNAQGGGALFSFVTHCLYYLEWFLGPLTGLSSRLFRLPNDERSGDTTVVMAFCFGSGTAGSLSMSSASYLGPGHRVEFYGEDGTLILENSTPDYMKGFRLFYGKRPDTKLRSIGIKDSAETRCLDGRILPTSRVAHRFLDWIERGTPSRPNFEDGLRVQKLLQVSYESNEQGRWLEIAN